MFQKKNEKELSSLKPEELAAHQKELMVRKAELLQKKKDGVIADEEQAELNDLAVYLVAVDKLAKRLKSLQHLLRSLLHLQNRLKSLPLLLMSLLRAKRTLRF